MHFKVRPCLTLSAAILAATVSLGSRADTLHPNGFIAPSQTFELHRDSHAQSGIPVGGFTGTFGSPAEDLVFWCFDLDHTFSFGNNYNYTEVAMADATMEQRLSQLFDEAYASVTAPPTGYSLSDASTAFQLAVWNLEYDHDATVFAPGAPGNPSNHFWVTGGPSNHNAQTLAGLWLTNLNKFTGDGWTISQLLSTPTTREPTHHQDFITATYTPPQRDLPEPPAWTLALAALAGLVLTRQIKGERARGG